MLAIGRHILAIQPCSHIIPTFMPWPSMALPLPCRVALPLPRFATGIGTEDPMTPIGIGRQVSFMPEAWDCLEESGFWLPLGDGMEDFSAKLGDDLFGSDGCFWRGIWILGYVGDIINNVDVKRIYWRHAHFMLWILVAVATLPNNLAAILIQFSPQFFESRQW